MNDRRNRRRTLLKALAVGAAAVPLAGTLSEAHTANEVFDVVILGAGLAGLSSALQLEMLGYRVCILEARNRVGGRVCTMRQFGSITEAGGSTVGGDYARFRGWARQLGVALEPQPPGDIGGSALAVRGVLMRAREWPSSPVNALPEQLHAKLPMALMFSLLNVEPVLLAPTDWTDPRYAQFDRMTLKDLLVARGASEETLRLCNIAPNTDDIATTSALWGLRANHRRLTAGRNPASQTFEAFRAVGGNSSLTKAMSEAIRGTIELDCKVTAVSINEKGAEVACANGKAYKAKAVVSTLPYGSLRDISIEPRLTGIVAEAVAALPRTAITQYHFNVLRPYWEHDGFPPGNVVRHCY
ncbi:MAG: FAD-dependent oxidoreductase [Rhodocyclaceae bacterium]|nr:FAD-dependent oxidoreductase [Rhodocyclaceae bacterium]MBK9311305.1 FAD-dependent oxidoreductase [Rhodocyclaceae bacterium]MBK9953755.1 FAD-dependent oxidoreductase [Rhodocyclaceae bacterium]